MTKDTNFYRPKVQEEDENTSFHMVPYRSLYYRLCEDTTGHGLPHINNAKGRCKVTLWILITIIAIVFMTYHCLTIVKTYLKFQVDVSLKIETQSKLNFPAVTVCNLNAFRESALDSAVTQIFTDQDQKARDFVDLDVSEYEGFDIEGTIDTRFLVSEWTSETISTLSDSQKRAIGHQKSSFIKEITYDGYNVRLKNLQWFFNHKYGNCFVFNSGANSSIITSSRTGSQWGLNIIFNIEQDDYISDLTEKAGVRVLIHDQNRSPFPDEDGIDISPGLATSVGIRLQEISRLSGLHWSCIDVTQDNSNINVFEERFPWTHYTLKGCMKTCFQSQLMSQCGCYDYRYPHVGQHLQAMSTDEVCKTENTIQEKCVNDIRSKFNDGMLKCGQCGKPCFESTYDMTISSALWPNSKYQQTLYDRLSLDADSKKIIDDNGFDDNFARLQIYYEELNYQHIDENENYEFGQFASDFGGVIGLWVGASVITVFEYIEYIVDMFALWILKKGNKGKHMNVSKIQVQMSHDIKNNVD